MTYELIKTLPVNNLLGEGITWDARINAVWWIDIYQKQLFRYGLDNEQIEQWPMPERIGCIGLTEDVDQLMVAFESGFARLSVASGEVTWLARPEQDRPGNRFNDGKVGPDGRFYAGCMVERPNPQGQMAGFYQLDEKGQTQRLLDGLMISNGLCWSPDGKIMYHADSPTRSVHRYDFDLASGTASNGQLFAQTAAHCVPDGATVDAQGNIWFALWGGSEVVKYAPDGDVALRLSVPVSQPTCVCFAGPELDLLFVTSARLGDQQFGPDDGDILIYKTDVRGLEPAIFKSS